MIKSIFRCKITEVRLLRFQKTGAIQLRQSLVLFIIKKGLQTQPLVYVTYLSYSLITSKLKSTLTLGCNTN